LTSIYSITSMSDHKAFAGCTRTTPAGPLPDDDCDGLANTWENQKWYDENNDGKRVSLPASVKSNHKDILVEIDTMVNHENFAAAIAFVKNKFLVAPVTNPDSLPGVNLVVILDKTDIPEPSTSSKCTSIWPGFQSLKSAHFGTASERLSNPNIVTEKEDIFHYGVAIHSQCNMAGISGNGEQPGNDIVFSLGDPGWADSDGDGHPDGNTDQKAASFMHELGHNLDLKHGGNFNTPPCKPNYFSVMNQLYMFAGIVPIPIIDYSNTNGRDNGSPTTHLINETGVNGLHEPHGIVQSLTSNFYGAIGHLNPPPAPALFWKTFRANGEPINYDWPTDGDTNEMNVVSSINFFKGFNPPCYDTTLDVSYGFKDWPNIKYWDPPEEAKGLTSNIQFQTNDKVGMGEMILVSSNTTANSPIETSGSQQSLSNDSGSNLLDDPSLPPCDLSDPVCTESPCDPDEPNCKTSFMTNITDPLNQTMDIGNRTAHSEPDVSINQIKNVTVSRIFALDALIQSDLFANSTNQNNNTEILSSIHEELITDSDSVIAHIQSNNYSKALLPLMKLQSLVLQTSPEKHSILIQIEETIAVVKNLI
jgi:hypothetical protein